MVDFKPKPRFRLSHHHHEINRLHAALATLKDLYRDDPPPLVRTASVALKGHIAWIERQKSKGP